MYRHSNWGSKDEITLIRSKYHKGRIRRPDVTPIHRKRNIQYSRLVPNCAAPEINRLVILCQISAGRSFMYTHYKKDILCTQMGGGGGPMAKNGE